MVENTEAQIRGAYTFMANLSGLDFQTRWGKTPYMEDFASQSDLMEFIESKGKFEPVSSHILMCIGYWILLKDICPNLSEVADSDQVIQRLWVHDIGEALVGDTPMVAKLTSNMNIGKDDEREAYTQLISVLPKKVQVRLSKYFEEFEEGAGEYLPIPARIARWIDYMQGDHFAITHGKNLSQHQEVIEKVIKKRSILRARQLIDGLGEWSQRYLHEMKEPYLKAAKEVEAVTRVHIKLIREAGVSVDLTEFGF